jgi:ribonuclease Z
MDKKMPKLIFLGTAAAVPDIDHENTHLLVEGNNESFLIDGPGSLFVRLQRAGVDTDKITHVILTHFHPDHISGIPSFLLALQMSGRTRKITFHANEHCMRLMMRFLDSFNWDNWCYFPVDFELIAEREMHLVWLNDEFEFYSSPMSHYVPTIGLRIECKQSGKVVVYSCDTAPNPNLVRLAKGADILIHEATGAGDGHSTAYEAGETARQANVKKLYLVHYPVYKTNDLNLVVKAAQSFSGPVLLASDFDQVIL